MTLRYLMSLYYQDLLPQGSWTLEPRFPKLELRQILSPNYNNSASLIVNKNGILSIENFGSCYFLQNQPVPNF